jgi:hypothetical protein
MKHGIRWLGLVAAVFLLVGSDALVACGDKFLMAGRGTRYQRPTNVRAAAILIYAHPSTGLPATLRTLRVDTLLKRQGHRASTVESVEQLTTILAGGRFDVILAASPVAATVEQLVGSAADRPLVVAVESRPRPASFLNAIDRAVEQRDRNLKTGL